LLANANTTFSGASGAATLTVGNGAQADVVSFAAASQLSFQSGATGGTQINGSLSMPGAANWIQFARMNTATEGTMTTGWTMADRGKTWFNQTTNYLRYWNGTQAVAPLNADASTTFSGATAAATLTVGNGTQADVVAFAAGAQVNCQPGTSNGTSLTGSIDMTGGAGNWLQLPRMTNAQETTMTSTWGASQAGRIWYNTSTNRARVWNGGAAQNMN
jgi:hypothetical protein